MGGGSSATPTGCGPRCTTRWPAYFNNDETGHATHDAATLRALLAAEPV